MSERQGGGANSKPNSDLSLTLPLTPAPTLTHNRNPDSTPKPDSTPNPITNPNIPQPHLTTGQCCPTCCKVCLWQTISRVSVLLSLLWHHYLHIRETLMHSYTFWKLVQEKKDLLHNFALQVLQTFFYTWNPGAPKAGKKQPWFQGGEDSIYNELKDLRQRRGCQCCDDLLWAREKCRSGTFCFAAQSDEKKTKTRREVHRRREIWSQKPMTLTDPQPNTRVSHDPAHCLKQKKQDWSGPQGLGHPWWSEWEKGTMS